MKRSNNDVVELRGRQLRYSQCRDLEASGTTTTTTTRRPARLEPENSSLSVHRPTHPPPPPHTTTSRHSFPITQSREQHRARATRHPVSVATRGGACSRSYTAIAAAAAAADDDDDDEDDESSWEEAAPGPGPWTIPQFSKEEKLRRSAAVAMTSQVAAGGGTGGRERESFEMMALSSSPKRRALSHVPPAAGPPPAAQRYHHAATEPDDEMERSCSESSSDDNDEHERHDQLQRLNEHITDDRRVPKSSVGTMIGGRRLPVSRYRPDSSRALSSYTEPDCNNADEAGNGKTVLGTALQFLYQMGYSVFNPNNVPPPVNDDQNVELTRSRDLVTGWMVMGKIRFWMVSLLVLLHVVESVKYAILNQAKQGVMYLYMTIICLLVRGCVKVMFISLFGLLWDDIVRFFLEYLKLAKTYLEPTWARALTIFACVAAVILSLVLSGIGTFKVQRTPKEAILKRSYHLAMFFLVWSRSKANDRSVLAKLLMTYGYHLTPFNIFLATLKFTLDATGFMSSYACIFIMFSISLSLHIMISVFEKTLPLGNWRFLMNIQKFSAMANSTFGTFFLGTHLNNLFTFANVLLALFELDIFTADFAYQCLNVMFIGVTYWLSAKVANKYDRIYTVTLDHFLDQERIWVDGRDVKLIPFLDQIKANKVGIGKGQFRITYKFMGKFLCCVGTFFLFLLEHKLQMLQNLVKATTGQQ